MQNGQTEPQGTRSCTCVQREAKFVRSLMTSNKKELAFCEFLRFFQIVLPRHKTFCTKFTIRLTRRLVSRQSLSYRLLAYRPPASPLFSKSHPPAPEVNPLQSG